MESYQLSNENLSILKSMTLGQRIKYFREALRNKSSNKHYYAATEVAKRIGITFQSLSAIENNKTKNPSFEVISNLCKDFDIPIDALTDNFYIQKEPDLVLNVDGEPNMIADVKSNIMEEDNHGFKLGYLMYQHFNNGDIRIIFNQETKTSLSKADLSPALARLIAEIQLLNQSNQFGPEPKYTKENKSPYNSALDVYYDLYHKEKGKYPIGSYSTWKELLANYIEHAKYHTEKKVKE